MRLTYTRKKTFNINDITIHYALAILLNKNLTNLKSLSDEKVTLQKKCMINFGSLIIDKISLVSNKMLTFIDCRLCVIKQMRIEFMAGFDAIMTCDF